MNARKSLYIVLPLIALVLMSCRFGNINISRQRVVGSGDLASEEREVSNIERVSVRGTGDLILLQGDEEGLTVEADDNLLPYIETRMEGRELVLEIQNGISIDTDNPIRYTLRVKDLRRIAISGSGNVEAEGFQTDDLGLEISGSGNIDMTDLEASELTVRISGSGNLDLAGTVQTQSVTISGSGNYRAGDLASAIANVVITGAGDITVWAEDELDVRITGSGTVRYYGSPNISQSITGGGTISGLGEHD